VTFLQNYSSRSVLVCVFNLARERLEPTVQRLEERTEKFCDLVCTRFD